MKNTLLGSLYLILASSIWVTPLMLSSLDVPFLEWLH